MTRKAVAIHLEQLVELIPHPADAFFSEWRCRLCRHRAGALDRESALNEAAGHLAEHHHAQGGYHRHHRTRRRRNR